MATINADVLSHTDLQRLRQADSLPLHKLCKQVQRENYHDWRAWERSQDWATILAGRYHTVVTTEGYTLTSDDHIAPVTVPLADYWTQRLQPTRSHPMDLLKLTMSKDALLDRNTLTQRVLQDADLPEHARALLPGERPGADNIRLALSYRLRPWQRFSHHSDTCRAIATPTKGAKGLDIWVHVQRITRGSVEYSPEPVCQVTGNGASQPYQVTITGHGYTYGDLVGAVGSAESLEQFGSTHYFESDLRKWAQAVLEDACVPLWPGISLVLTPEAHARAQALESLLGRLDAGHAKISLLSLDNTPVNREALARELADGFTTQLERLTERLGYTAPNYPAVQGEYDALVQQLALAESVLGVEIDCLDAQVAVEMGLSAAEAA